MIQKLQTNPNEIPLYFFASMNKTDENWEFQLYDGDSFIMISDAYNYTISFMARKPNNTDLKFNCSYDNGRIIVNLNNHPELVNFYGILRGIIEVKRKSDGTVTNRASFTVQVNR